MARRTRLRDSRPGELLCALIVISGKHPGKIRARINQDLSVIRLCGAANSRLERGAREGTIASLAIDLPDLHRRAEGAARSQPLVDPP
jgi:hypothetical protein